MPESAKRFSRNCCFPAAIPDGKSLRTFPGIAVFPPQFRTENRYALFLELL
jgi:hypothetical protein